MKKKIHLIIILFLLYPKITTTNQSLRLKSKDDVESNKSEIISTRDDNQNKKNYKNTAVKLNMKQNFIMNQIISFYALSDKNVKNDLCRNQSEEIKMGLRAFEGWALKMFDSSSKLQAGILNGNLMDYGAFKQCISIQKYTQYGNLIGKHCSISLKPDKKLIWIILKFRNVSKKRFEKIWPLLQDSKLQWSICVPESCQVEDIKLHFEHQTKLYIDGLNVNISLDELDCYSILDEKPFGRETWTIIFFFATLLGLILICTCLDIKFKRNSNSKNNTFVESFSLISNAKYILYKGKNSEELSCLNGLRAGSIFYVVAGHRFLMSLFYPTVNSLEITEWLLKITSSLILSGTICVDTFFLISGLLVTYLFFEKVNKGEGFSLFHFYMYRYIRLTPSYGIVILFYSYILEYFGSGPHWKKTIEMLKMPCRKYWWSALLYAQNYLNPNSLCILQTWYLTCDMQFYLFSPIILYPLWKKPLFGLINLIIFYLISLSIPFYTAWHNEYTTTELVTPRLIANDFFPYFYITSHTRAPPYFLGMFLGLILYKTKGKKFKIHRALVIFNWLASFALLISMIFINNVFQQENYEYNKLEASFYLAFSRSFWALAVAWIVFACANGYGGFINSFLSLHFFKIVGRISYSVFLVHMSFQYLKNGATKLPAYFSNLDLVYKAIADFLFALVLGFILTICVEYPLVGLMKLLFRKKKTKAVQDVTFIKNIPKEI